MAQFNLSFVARAEEIAAERVTELCSQVFELPHIELWWQAIYEYFGCTKVRLARTTGRLSGATQLIRIVERIFGCSWYHAEDRTQCVDGRW